MKRNQNLLGLEGIAVVSMRCQGDDALNFWKVKWAWNFDDTLVGRHVYSSGTDLVYSLLVYNIVIPDDSTILNPFAAMKKLCQLGCHNIRLNRPNPQEAYHSTDSPGNHPRAISLTWLDMLPSYPASRPLNLSYDSTLLKKLTASVNYKNGVIQTIITQSSIWAVSWVTWHGIKPGPLS